jgi:hypothetical protein
LQFLTQSHATQLACAPVDQGFCYSGVVHQTACFEMRQSLLDLFGTGVFCRQFFLQRLA